jgi:hypothetical protein
MSRRAVLAGGLALGLGACTTEAAPPAPDPDVAIRRAVAAGVRELLGRYAGVSAAHPASASRLAPLAAEHTAHLHALGVRRDRPAAGRTPQPTPTPTGNVRRAVADLAAAEQRIAALRPEQARRASPLLARLVASIGACEAAHAALLSARTLP